MTLYQDSNGLYLAKNSGIHIDTIQALQSDYFSAPTNKYGAALYDDSLGGTSFYKCNFSEGVVPIFLGPDSSGNEFHSCFGFENYTGEAVQELNAPFVVIADGSYNDVFIDLLPVGQIQLFNVTNGANISLTMNSTRSISNLGQSYYTPNNLIWLYNEQPGATANNVIVDPFGFDETNNGKIAFTTGGFGSWAQFSGTQIAQFAQLPSVMLPQNGQAVSLPNGLNLSTSPISQAEMLRSSQFGAYTFQETDSGSTITSGSSPTTVTWTIPNTISPTNTQAWSVWLIVQNGSTITVAPASGATLLEGGTSVSSVTLTKDVPYQLICPINATGTTAQCYIIKQLN